MKGKDMTKKFIAFLLIVCALCSLSLPSFATNSAEIALIIEKLKENSSTSDFEEEEIISLFKFIDDSENLNINISEVAKWVKAERTINAENISIALHEELHVFTYGEKNCERVYGKAEIKTTKIEDGNYGFQNEIFVAKAVPVYLKTEKTIKNPSSYSVIREYLVDSEMLSNKYGLNGIISEYYAFVRELNFLIKYKSFCDKYGIEDTASARIKKMILACDEWKKATDEYVGFIEANYDGLVYKELTDTGTLGVLERINKEYTGIDTQEALKAKSITPVGGKEEVVEGKNQPPAKATLLSIFQIVSNFFETLYIELKNWVSEFFATIRFV